MQSDPQACSCIPVTFKKEGPFIIRSEFNRDLCLSKIPYENKVNTDDTIFSKVDQSNVNQHWYIYSGDQYLKIQNSGLFVSTSVHFIWVEDLKKPWQNNRTSNTLETDDDCDE